MNVSWGFNLTPLGVILLLGFIIVAIITSIVQIVFQINTSATKRQDSTKQPETAKIAVWTAVLIISTLTLSVLSNYLYAVLEPILIRNPSAGVDPPLASISVPASEVIPTPTSESPFTPEPTAIPIPAPTAEPAPVPAPPPIQNVDPLIVSATYEYEYISFLDVNALIHAKTTVAATRVVMSWSNMDGSSHSQKMQSLNRTDWIFFANFFEPGTFVITITAYDENGQSASTVLNVLSPVS